MTFLPIVERELRLASRRRMTYWLRPITAGFLLIVFGMFISLAMLARGAFNSTLGPMIFATLKWMAFAFAAAWGIFLPSDSLSEEKREGTLGLLFLTDLRGYDVVLGKLISLSLQSFYGMLAVFPIMGLALLVGGVTGMEFWRSALAMCNTLFFSLAIGLFVSSMSREVLKAMNAAAALNLLFLVILPWADLWIAHWDEARWKPILSIASPGYFFYTSPNLHPADYWKCFAVQNLIAWVFLAGACVIVPRAWHDKSNSKKGIFASLTGRWRFGGKKARIAFRRKLLSRDPILWLALRDHWMPRFIGLITVLAACFLAWNIYVHLIDEPLQNAPSTMYLLNLAVTLWLAALSCKFYLEAVRSGAMELILVTPVPPQQVVRSQWKALLRMFWFPILFLVVLRTASDFESIIQIKKSMATVKGVPANFDWEKRQIISEACDWVNFYFWIAAMAWFGMWMGLTNRKISIAVLKVILFVAVLPWIIEIFLMVFAMMPFTLMKWPIWASVLPPAIFEFAKNIFFILWSRHRLMTRFRETVAETGSPARRKNKFVPAPPPIAVEPRPLVS